MSLPFPHIPVFDVDPLQYKNFIWGFVLSVESKANKTDCLYLFIYSFILEQFMKGPSQRWWVVASTFPLKEATKWLKSFVRSNLEMNTELLQLTDKVLAWLLVEAEDVKALQAFSVFVWGCDNLIEKLLMPTNTRAILTVSFQIQRAKEGNGTCYNRRAGFNDLVLFVKRHVKISTDPLFGDIQDMARGSPGRSWTNPHSRISKVNGSSFATTVTEGPCWALQKLKDSIEKKNIGCMCLLFTVSQTRRLSKATRNEALGQNWLPKGKEGKVFWLPV